MSIGDWGDCFVAKNRRVAVVFRVSKTMMI